VHVRVEEESQALRALMDRPSPVASACISCSATTVRRAVSLAGLTIASN
jgi:hypothetical protein